MRKRVARVAQTEETRRRLLDAAGRVFLRRGFAGTSLDLIVREAGLTKGAVYSRFRSKADLFLALLEARIEQRIAEMHAVAAAEHGSVGLAGALSRHWDDRMPADLDWFRVAIEFRLHAARIPALNRRYAALHGRLRQALAAVIEREAHDDGQTLPIPADEVARAAMALLTGTVLERCADGDAYPEHLNETINRAVVLGLPAAVEASGPRRARRATR
jgi:AcrR family transcriptional regulator